MIDLTPAVEVIIAACAAFVARYVIPLAIEQIGQTRAKKIFQWALIGVKAAEQIYGSGAGKEKLEYVKSFLAARGFSISPDEITAAIEAAVFQISNIE